MVPGMSEKNIPYVLREGVNLRGLCNSTLAQLTEILRNESNARRLHDFVNKRIWQTTR